MQIPSNWELSSFGGKADTGYLALEDETHLRLQLHWERASTTLPSLDHIFHAYRQQVDSMGKLGKPVSFTNDTLSLNAQSIRGDMEMELFSWDSEQQVVYGAAWRCKKCKRYGILEVHFTPDDASPNMAGQVINSIVDHRADNQILWSVYGFQFLTPSGYALESNSLQPGRFRFYFRGERRTWLNVERWSVADQCLHKLPLADWPSEMLRLIGLDSDQAKIKTSAFSFRGHPGYKFTYSINRSGVFRRWDETTGVMWHCPKDDKLFSVIAGSENPNLVTTVATSIRCS